MKFLLIYLANMPFASKNGKSKSSKVYEHINSTIRFDYKMELGISSLLLIFKEKNHNV